MPSPRPSVILADDHPLVLEGLSKLLKSEFDVVATAEDGERLLSAARRLQPDFVVADIAMPSVDGFEAIRRLATISPSTRAVILSFHSEVTVARNALAAGAWAYVPKSAVADEVILALREVGLGRIYISPSVTSGVVTIQEQDMHPITDSLTPREQEVVALVGKGLSNLKIAEALGISVTTVRTHLSSIYAKLGNGSRVELALFFAADR